jgi:hypothetical protein
MERGIKLTQTFKHKLNGVMASIAIFIAYLARVKDKAGNNFPALCERF